MSLHFDQVFQAAMGLPETERAELVDSLIASFTPSSAPLDDAWIQEIHRRTAEVDAGKVEMIPWEVVRERVHAQVFGRD